MSNRDELKLCPDCAEEVRAEARVCRFCGYRFCPPLEPASGADAGDESGEVAPTPAPDQATWLPKSEWWREAPGLEYVLEHPDFPIGQFRRGVLEGMSATSRGRRSFEKGWRRDTAKRAKRLSQNVSRKVGPCDESDIDVFAATYGEAMITRPDDPELQNIGPAAFGPNRSHDLDYSEMRELLAYIQQLMKQDAPVIDIDAQTAGELLSRTERLVTDPPPPDHDGGIQALEIQRDRVVSAPPTTVWGLIEDPHGRPRWWPGVHRIERVSEAEWTEVYRTYKGREVRATFNLLGSEAPHRRSWEQQLVGTPFESFLDHATTELLIEPDPSGSRVTIKQCLQFRSDSEAESQEMEAARASMLDEALEGLSRCCH